MSSLAATAPTRAWLSEVNHHHHLVPQSARGLIALLRSYAT